MFNIRRSRLMLPSVLLLVMLALVSALPIRHASAASPSQYDYLALGDSVAFGFNPLLDPTHPAQFIAYPNVVATELNQALPTHATLINAACPGETTSHFVALSGADLSCGAYRALYPLHVPYTSSQLDFAVAYLTNHPQTRLVTINVGSDDLGILIQQCAMVKSCILQGLPAVLATVTANLTGIYTRLRTDAHYQYRIVALTYYSPDYNNQLDVLGVTAINRVITATTLAAGGAIADGFAAFKLGSIAKGGDPCAAGLLIQLTSSPLTCDIHPSAKGRNLLGGYVTDAVHSLDK